jgi:hypothetical protein
VKKKLLIAILFVILMPVGCFYAYREARLRSVPKTVWDCLRHPRQMTLYSIHPEESRLGLEGAQFFHGYRVLGQVLVTSALDQQRVADAIRRAVLTPSIQFACFNPRHAVHVTDGHNSYDLLICYECEEMDVFDGENLVAATDIAGSPNTLNSILLAGKISK